jgi:hypothetical protein
MGDFHPAIIPAASLCCQNRSFHVGNSKSKQKNEPPRALRARSFLEQQNGKTISWDLDNQKKRTQGFWRNLHVFFAVARQLSRAHKNRGRANVSKKICGMIVEIRRFQ